MSLVIQHVQLEVTVDNGTIMKVHQTKDDLSGIEPVGGVSVGRVGGVRLYRSPWKTLPPPTIPSLLIKQFLYIDT